MTIFHCFHFKYIPNIKNMLIFFVTNFFSGQGTIKLFFARTFFFRLFKITHMLIRVKSFCLIRPNTLLSNSRPKVLKQFLLKFLIKLSNGELRNRKLSIKFDLLLTLKLIYLFSPFRKTTVLSLNLLSSCRIIWGS